MRNASLFAILIFFMVGTTHLSFGQCSSKDDLNTGPWENSDAEVRCPNYAALQARLVPKLLPNPEGTKAQPELLITSLKNTIIHDIWDPVPELQILGRTAGNMIEDLAIDRERILRRRA